jgi:hypothetical protein
LLKHPLHAPPKSSLHLSVSSPIYPWHTLSCSSSNSISILQRTKADMGDVLVFGFVAVR